MLSVFPQLLTWAFFGPTLLRIAAGVFIGLEGLAFLNGRGNRHYTLSGIRIGVAVILIGGLFTQIGAILLILLSVGTLYTQKFVPNRFGKAAHALLIVIGVALLVLGPGAFAFDLPL